MLAGLSVTSSGSVERFSFVFGSGAFRDNEIFDSATCPPSRYVVEVGRRMIRAVPSTEVLIIGNPLLPLSPQQLAEWSGAVRSVPAIVTDARKFPILYVLPRRLFDDLERFLLSLSTMDGDIDRRLLQLVTGQEVSQIRTPGLEIKHFPVTTPTNWFQGEVRQQMLKVLSLAAIQTIERNPGWRNLPFATYQPYHAGSLLFLNLAARQVPDGFFKKQILCWTYKDIYQSCPGPLEPVWLRLPWLPRDNSVGELEYLARSLERLGQDVIDNHFIVFMRYSRNYSVPPFHLIDQVKFALGESMTDVSRTVHGQPPACSDRPDLPPHPLKLLFHLVGGWSLKSYRDNDAATVFTVLKSLGCDITVIDRPDLAARLGVRSIISDDTERLTAAVKSHHIFIGVDSFPHHFVRHVLGWPTIGLFANTKPCNSDAKEAPDYRPVVGNLPCNPCGGHDSCPVLGGENCANFADPAQLITAILGMASDLYGFTF
ncbi:hypothetical protein [Telmatospirillum siberiense]|uniref:Heptosyltransferase n=1 Tax=Telmatospirillum siberiense TaxID=382514 RepID=A0A2N3PZZ5_9PROT|nr:hypothetical protein [Telmatospirillum siberiense]PKU25972.1 hypothetical protein CWS72_02180 [Telmatospirillum siberiense]